MKKNKIRETENKFESSKSWQESDKAISSIYNSMSEGLAIHEIIYDRSGKAIDYSLIDINPAVTNARTIKKKVAEEELKEVQEKLWSVLNATRESIYMFNRDGIITMCNMVGVERKDSTDKTELIGHHFSEFLSPEITKGRQAKFDEIFKYGKPLEFEDERNGRIYHHNFFPVFKGSDVTHVVNYSADITERKRFSENLRESEERFRTIAESVPVQILITRISDYTIRFTNKAYEKNFGYEKKDLLGTRVKDLYYNPNDREKIDEILNKYGRLDDMEVRAKRADGSPVWIIMSLRKIMFEGEPSYLNSFVDISETKKAQEELLRLNRTLVAHNKSSQAMMHSKHESTYLKRICNIILKYCGYKMIWIGYAQNDKQKSVKPMEHCGFDDGYIDQLDITWEDNEKGQGPTGTAIRTGKPSLCRNMQTDPAFEPWREAAIKRGFASSLVLPLKTDGKAFGAMSIYSDEPDPFSKREIELLSDLAKDLSYGIYKIRLEESERAAIKIIKENEIKLKELIVTKDKFFNIVAHDLKNPFTSLLGSSELLYENIEKMTPGNIKKLALILNDSAKGGYSILQNLLDWSRSQTGTLKITPEKIDLKNLLKENISNLQVPAVSKEIKIIYDSIEDINLITDKNMLNTVIRNLLSNALKFSYRQGTVTVNAKIEKDGVVISIKDSGIGILTENIEKLFNIDSRNSMPGTENEQGTGLGLKLCKEFIEKLNGRIWVESKENKGSTFSFSVPKSPCN